ncbi:MAG: phosphatidylserine decarboxylase family protein [Nitrospirae bacterium]|jgi:phosphatidylserine decarboxylase|nr:phosphatidylserine decarboxylase family protein [Nitrospirota bacterium]
MRISENHFKTPVVREGIPFVGLALGIFLVCLYFLGTAGLIAGLIPLFVLNFFRNPDRKVPDGKGNIVSPADGKIVKMQKDPQTGRWKVAIFMNVFDVHVNRIPVTSVVRNITYVPGKFLNADLDKASEYNERNTLLLQTEDGQEISMTQVAGLIARRIVCYAEISDRLPAGTTFGLIRFGSRVDLDLPEKTILSVGMGQRVKGGESILGTLPSEQSV